jgi:DNA-directed RNA polymerase specialized sigma24 family protein
MNLSNETLQVIQKIAKKLAPKYAFGYFSVEDIEQEATIIAFTKLAKYKEATGPLQAFLYTAIGNGLKNFKRKHYHRLSAKHCDEPGCETCFARSQYTSRKKNLMSPNDIDEAMGVEDSYHMSALESLEMEETITLIDEKLPGSMRADYLKMRDSIKIPKSRRLLIESEITRILEEYYE